MSVGTTLVTPDAGGHGVTSCFADAELGNCHHCVGVKEKYVIPVISMLMKLLLSCLDCLIAGNCEVGLPTHPRRLSHRSV